MTRLVYRLSTGLKVYDTQTGLRAFHKDLLPRMLGIPGERYEYEMNVLLELAKARTPIIEEEIETIYLDNNSSSHFDTVWDSLRVYREILRFSASSLAGFLVDYAMYSALILATGSLRLSNIAARVVSASVNYTLNRKFVFRSRCGILSSALSYFLLAAAILACNTLVLEYLVGSLGIGRLFAKILTELLFLPSAGRCRDLSFSKGGRKQRKES
jgi:putative flippase GtrA